MFKKALTTVFILLISLVLIRSVSATEDKKIYFFYGNGCPHCSNVEKWFEEENIYENYEIESLEIYSNKDNAIFFNNKMTALGIPANKRGVPTMIIGKQVLVGDTPIINSFYEVADAYLQDSTEVDDNKESTASEKASIGGDSLTWAAVIGASIVDAINPCAFAVLIILLTTILTQGDKRKALKSGLAFSLSIFISYLLMGLGIYKALDLGGFSSSLYKVIGGLAIVLGLFNLKDYLWYGKGFLMEVPMSWRPKLKSLLKSVTSPIGAFFTGFLVSLFLLPCTSGPYIVILGLLAQKEFQTQALLYLIVYNLIFVAPMILISFAVFKGFSPDKAEEIRQRNLKNIHLIAAIILLAMGGIILLNAA